MKLRHSIAFLLLAACLALPGLPPVAAPPTASGSITTGQADSILEELRAIRTLLEQEAASRKTTAPATPAIVRLPWVDRPTLGKPDAEVIVIEFTDYACPYCRNFHQASWPVLKRDFVDTGLIQWTVRDLPLPIHPDAGNAAQAAHCAGEQGYFWEMRSVLFANQPRFAREALEKYAIGEGLRSAAFGRCLDSGSHLSAIDSDAREAAEARITGTPTFLVGRRKGNDIEGRLIVGAQSSAVFDGAIRLELAKP